MVGTITFPANILKKIYRCLFFPCSDTASRWNQSRSHSVPILHPDLSRSKWRPPPVSPVSSLAVGEPGWAVLGPGSQHEPGACSLGDGFSRCSADVPLGAWQKCFLLRGEMCCQCTLTACRQPLRWLFIKCCKLDPCSVRNASSCMFSPLCSFVIGLHCIPVFIEKDE